MKRLAHTLKSGSGNMGARRMAKLSEEMEAKTGIDEETKELMGKLEKEYERVCGVLEGERGASVR
jgi:HPt (histidine-containing phosphotransfer) domain-containing protein